MQKEQVSCIYCGKLADTREHVPPKQLFKGDTKINLITVPSCLACNRSFQPDEDFFRQFWASMLMDRSLEAKRFMDGEITRSIKRAPALALKMFRQMRLVNRISPSGVYLGRGTVFRVTDEDGERVDCIVGKIIKGLFFNKFKTTIPKDWLIKILWITPELEKRLSLQDMAKTLRWDVIKEDTFAYGFNYVPETYQSIWILDLFKIPLFYVLVLDPKTAEEK